MSKIANGSNSHCIERGISTMRLALGYEKGLPDNWEIGERDVLGLIYALGLAFPDHKVLAWYNEAGPAKTLPNVQAWQTNEMPDLTWDEYLIAFAYGEDGRSHFVIGTPTQFNGQPSIVFIMGVLI